ncbi:S8 family serine peptidase [Nonomuraea sp. NBC_01738]|uniref:S8 family serine peptidase n=1 Tax=Nonomuraea sp. NBC_01738 TaxID=2976003 RepID=UPI002E15502F|nr:S8 family serine peptidase [Nonomuraea sp. NBC_01738]
MRIARIVTALALAAGTLWAVPGPALATPGALTGDMRAAFADGGTADFWVRMSGKADLAPARTIKNRTARGAEVVEQLQAVAGRAQEPLRDLLKAEGVKSTAYWVTNAVYVKGASEDLARKIARLDGVAELRAPKTYAIPEPVRTTALSATVQGVAWGVADVNADDVWATTGRRGEDIVVANVDSGVQFDHPALVGSYRGNNGDGTFTHDYNWIDPRGDCASPAPCDEHGHGTHTMGTVAGDDGAGTQIGVAPGVKWIAGLGCPGGTCPDEALIASSQWMLAPTDLSGQHPDPAKRPHIVNNSWGSDPSNDPLFEDIQLAWAASGIMGVWANGNNGPGCDTSGAPGSRAVNYSVGAYGADHKIAGFSSRGSGQDGRIKPDISAPGVQVLSALPGSTYGAWDGTSMATPHVAGAIALLWSARPEYIRDLESTRLLLDLSAVDTDDTTCGGTPADNNVYGEGRLDALALIQAGTVGTATLKGTVTDAGTKQPIPGATLALTGPMNRTATLGADGAYAHTLVAGDYQLKVTAFGYRTATETVTVTRESAIIHDVALTPTERVNLTGTVTDGSGRGGPVGAKITADDGAGHRWSAEADPETGAYSLGLLPSTTYTVTYAPTGRGYDPATRTVAAGESGQRLDVALTVSLACDAPGYEVTREGVTQPFNGTAKPRGWTVTNLDLGIPNYAHRPGWEFADPGKRGNHTGGDGGFAVVDSLNSGKGHLQDTYLTSPVHDLTGRTKAALEFAHDLRPAINSSTAVDLSLDGGATWKTVWSVKGYPGASGPATQVIPIPEATGRSDVRFRLHYRGQRSGWWAVDDVFVGDRTCAVAS